MATTSGVQRQNIFLDWEKDVKTKTCKCKLCGERVKHFSTKCRHCNIRICSECSEPEGDNSEQHKAMASDYLTQGCWCGFAGGFNPAFSGRIPAATKRPTVARGATAQRKRKSENSEEIVIRDEHTVLLRSSSLSDTITMDSPLRKRSRITRDPAVDLSNLARDSSAEPRSRRRGPAIVAKDVFIIGAGVVGLFIAFELAKKMPEKYEKYRITVLDINERPCVLASGHSAGIISVHDMKESWVPLLEAATTAWAELRSSDDFDKAVSFSDRVYTTTKASDGPPVASPSWYRGEASESLVSDTEKGCNTLGKVDPAKLAAWLQRECKQMGVRFRFGTHPYRIERNGVGQMISVRMRKSLCDSSRAKHLPCTDLIFATGPYTASTWSVLFPETPLNLRNYSQASEWLSIRSQVEKSEGVVMPDSEHHAGPVSITASRASSTIQLSAVQPVDPRRKIRVGDTSDRRGASPALHQLASQHLVLPDKNAVFDHGSVLVSTANGQNPMLGKVMDTMGGSVWLCYGFGNHGTTLAPGVGRLMREMVLGEANSVDLRDFAVVEPRPSK